MDRKWKSNRMLLQILVGFIVSSIEHYYTYFISGSDSDALEGKGRIATENLFSVLFSTYHSFQSCTVCLFDVSLISEMI